MILATYHLHDKDLVRELEAAHKGSLLDVTIKTGDRVFAPSQDLFTGAKSGNVSREVYAQRFNSEMKKSRKVNKQRWFEVASKDVLLIGCYCKPGKFCHRRLLVEHFQKFCHKNKIGFTFMGEVMKGKLLALPTDYMKFSD